jgi:hypothetical protein
MFFLACVSMSWLILASILPWWPDVIFLAYVSMAWLILASILPWWPNVFFANASAWHGSF